MRRTVDVILMTLLVLLISFLIILGIDTDGARKDYLRAKEQGNYEQPITGCIFQAVCDRYTKELWK